MKRGDVIEVPRGRFKGAVVRVVTAGNPKTTVEFVSYFEDDEDCWDVGDDGVIPTADLTTVITDPLKLVNAEIRDMAMALRGLLIKRKHLTNPLKTNKEIAKLLACIDV